MFPLEGLVEWFLANRRVFPWRQERSPYGVLVSEIMLQQTRAEVVIPYFHKWMEEFPSISVLARAPEDKVIKLWEGLGYYSRARNLIKAAITIEENYGGQVPNSYEKLVAIKGIGPYTASAILSFAFGMKSPALDGNVKRVLARYIGFEKEITQYEDFLRGELLKLLPEKKPELPMEGLIELGALICKKKPICSVCPLKHKCLAFKKGLTAVLPIKKAKEKSIPVHRFVACLQERDGLYLERRLEGEVMAGLWEFPYIESEKDPLLSWGQAEIEERFKCKLKLIKPLPVTKHTFTKYQAHLYPYLFEVLSSPEERGILWCPKKHVNTLPFSSGHRKVKNLLLCCGEK